jgi:hypothetical protein
MKAQISQPFSSRICFHNTLKAHYACPEFIFFEISGEFQRDFKHICESSCIEAKPTANTIMKLVQKLVLVSFGIKRQSFITLFSSRYCISIEKQKT